MRICGILFVVLFLACVRSWAEEPWDTTTKNGELSRTAFLKSWHFVLGWLQCADPVTGLIPRNLKDSPYWNAKDSAADNYPFMVLTSFFTDRELFDGRMKQILETEQRLCNRVGRLPDDWLFSTQAFRTPTPVMANLVFGASEYAKDGLLPLTEWLGPSVWSDRMRGMVEDLWTFGAIDTEVGKIPATSHEVAGNLLQVMSRMYWMTGEETYRKRAFLIGDYFLLHHPPEQADQLKLGDHGCEVVNGLSEVYYLAAQKDPKKHAQWKPSMHRLLDRILEVGRDENGLLYRVIEPKTGKIINETRTDNWGYNYNAFLVVAETDQEPRYREAVEHVLSHLLNNKDYVYEGGSSDGYADALEGGINLMNRVPIPQAQEWADHVAQILLAKPRDTGVIEGWHGDGNFARTAIMYALWKTQGAYVEPWRADVRVGAVRTDDGFTCFEVRSDFPWKGKLRFDIPRHAENLNIPSDYTRLNQFPEWFTVLPDTYYDMEIGQRTGTDLRAGLSVSLTPDKPFRIRLKAQPTTPSSFKIPFNAKGAKNVVKWQDRVRGRLLEIVQTHNPKQDRPLDVTMDPAVDAGEYTKATVRFMGNEGVPIEATLTIPKGSKPFPAVICLHGHAGNRDMVFDPAEIYHGFAAEYARRGFVTLSPSLSHMPYAANQLWNLMRLVDVLQGIPQVDPNRIGVAGLSMGGEWTMWLAACDPRIRAAVVSGWMCTTEGVLRVPNCPCWRPAELLDLCDIADVHLLIAPRPLLIESAEADPCFPIDACRKGYARIRSGYDLLKAVDKVKQHTFPGGHAWNGAEAYPFIEAALKP